MINRQTMRDADTKATAKAPGRTKQNKEAGAGSSAKGNQTPWHGDEVLSSSPQGASSAEDGAARAEGNGPVRAEVAARDPDPGTYTEKGPARRPRAKDADAAENAEEKRQSAAEEHASQPSRHPPYGRL